MRCSPRLHVTPASQDYGCMDCRFGQVTLQRVRIEAVAAERAGAVGACLAPVYTLRASLRPWLRCAVGIIVNQGVLIRVRCVAVL